MLRAKGFLWLASAHDELILFSIAGQTLTVEPQAHWLAADNSEEEHDEDTREYIGHVWEPEYGDRRQEIVFIGVDMDQKAIEASLNAALLTAEEMSEGPAAWAKLNDPFAAMFTEQIEAATL